MAAGLITVVLLVGVAVAALTIPFGSRIYTGAFWRPETGFARNEMATLRAALRALAQLVGMLLLLAFGVAVAVGMLYLLIWMIHVMWRAT